MPSASSGKGKHGVNSVADPKLATLIKFLLETGPCCVQDDKNYAHFKQLDERSEGISPAKKGFFGFLFGRRRASRKATAASLPANFSDSSTQLLPPPSPLPPPSLNANALQDAKQVFLHDPKDGKIYSPGKARPVTFKEFKKHFKKMSKTPSPTPAPRNSVAYAGIIDDYYNLEMQQRGSGRSSIVVP